MARQLQAFVVACVLAMTPMMLTQTIELVPVVSAAQMDTPSWAIFRIADYSNCPDPAACQANFRDVTTVYCGLWALANVVGGFLCALTSIV